MVFVLDRDAHLSSSKKKGCLEILEKDNVAWMIPPDWVALVVVGRAADLIFQQTSTRYSTQALEGCQHSEKSAPDRHQGQQPVGMFLKAPDFGEVSGDVTFSAQKIGKREYPTVMSCSRRLAQVTKELMTTMKSNNLMFHTFPGNPRHSLVG